MRAPVGSVWLSGPCRRRPGRPAPPPSWRRHRACVYAATSSGDRHRRMRNHRSPQFYGIPDMGGKMGVSGPSGGGAGLESEGSRLVALAGGGGRRGRACPRHGSGWGRLRPAGRAGPGSSGRRRNPSFRSQLTSAPERQEERISARCASPVPRTRSPSGRDRRSRASGRRSCRAASSRNPRTSRTGGAR